MKCFIILMIFLSGCSKIPDKENPDTKRLTCQERILDLGDVTFSPDHKFIPFSFTIHNIDTIAIPILDVDVSCDCVKIDSYPKILYPRTNGGVIGKIDLSELYGNFNRSIYLRYGEDDVLILRIKGRMRE